MVLAVLEQSIRQLTVGIHVPELLRHPEGSRASILHQQLTVEGLGDLARGAFLGSLSSQAGRQFHRTARKAIKALPVQQRRSLLRSTGGNLDRFLSGLQWTKSDVFWPVFALSIPMLRRDMFSIAAIQRSQLEAFAAGLNAVADRRAPTADDRPALKPADVAILMQLRSEADTWLAWFHLDKLPSQTEDREFSSFLTSFVGSVATWLPKGGRERNNLWIRDHTVLLPRIIELWNAYLDDWFLAFEAVESLWE